MSKMKTEFQMSWDGKENNVTDVRMFIETKERVRVHVLPYNAGSPVYIKDKDLERFAVNILKALKSKKLKP